MAQLPKPVRAYIGLWARAVSEARELPRRVAEFPVIAASSTARATLRVGQQYADLVNRGDDVLARLQGAPEEPPSWATFDDELDEPIDVPTVHNSEPVDEPAESATRPRSVHVPRGRRPSAFDEVADADLGDTPESR